MNFFRLCKAPRSRAVGQVKPSYYPYPEQAKKRESAAASFAILDTKTGAACDIPSRPESLRSSLRPWVVASRDSIER